MIHYHPGLNHQIIIIIKQISFKKDILKIKSLIIIIKIKIQTKSNILNKIIQIINVHVIQLNNKLINISITQ